MATAVPEGVNFSGCLQGIESCCLTWAQLSCLLDLSAGACISYKRWQPQNHYIQCKTWCSCGVADPFRLLSFGFPIYWMGFFKRFADSGNRMEVSSLACMSSRKPWVSLWPSFALVKKRKFETCIQVCACCLCLQPSQRGVLGQGGSVRGASAGLDRAQAIGDDHCAATSSVELKQVRADSNVHHSSHLPSVCESEPYYLFSILCWKSLELFIYAAVDTPGP